MEKIKVLIPTDFSVQAEYAYILVNKMSQKAPMEIHFIHVMNMPDTVTMDSNGNISTCGEIDVNYVVAQRDIAKRKLAQLQTLYGEDKFTHLVLGKTNQAILDFAESNKFDLIAMGTKGAWGLKEKLSGSETQLVARKSSVPVLSLMCDRSELEIENMLLVHQFDEDSIQELGLLKKIVAAFQPKIHLLEIIKNDAVSTDTIYVNMDKFAAKHGLNNVEKHIMNDKDVENGVIHFNQMNNMDLVCIGTHGKGGHLFHSSATEKLINHMFKPIISFQLK
jgi:nucleotide-binding universal stress UspA family protein